MYKTPKKSRKTLWYLLVFVLLVCVAVYIFVIRNNPNSENSTVNTDTDSLTGDSINYKPASKEEIEAGEQTNLKQEDNSTPKDKNGDNIVNPLISTWTQNFQSKNLELNAFVPELTENGGACKLTITKDSQSITKDKKAQADAQTTTCGIIEVEKSKLENGVWIAIVEYSSPTSYGKSNPVEVEIK
jgi:hypothetical protein